MAERSNNIWAPWRMEYLDQLHDASPGGGCFLCRYRDQPADDARNHVLRRTDKTLLLLNRYPYNGGHLLAAPTAHTADLEALSDDVLLELINLVRLAKRALETALNAQGFNIGLNLGRCAGAGLPEHVHLHVVPRWSGDTNFMPVLGDVRIIPQALDQVYQRLRQALGGVAS
jgi:ATP adenylyltransferase